MDDAQSRRERFDSLPLHRTLGLKLDDAGPGFAKVSLATSAVTLGGIGGSVHGGLLAAMVDVAILEAVLASLEPDDQPGGTADLNITYLRPALGARVLAEARILRKGRTLTVAEVAITDEEGRLCAKGRAIYVLRKKGG